MGVYLFSIAAIDKFHRWHILYPSPIIRLKGSPRDLDRHIFLQKIGNIQLSAMMKTIIHWMGFFLVILGSSAGFCCGQAGTKGVISDDGQSIVRTEKIPLREQARLYGGYAHAADYIEQNRRSIVGNDHFSLSVKGQVDNDLKENVSELRCWAASCAKDESQAECQL